MSLIQIKRSTTTADPVQLQEGEMAWTGNGNILFIGDDTTNAIAVGTELFPGVLTANAVLCANATGEINEIRIDTLNVASFGITSISDFANSSQLGASAGGSNVELATTNAIMAYIDGQGAASNFGSLTDVTLTSEANNQFVIYDESAGQWENHSITGTANEVELTFTDNDLQIGLPSDVTVTTSLTIGTSVVKANNGIIFNTNGLFADGANGITVDAAGINVTPNNGITVTADGVFADGANGITVTADGINVNGSTGVTVTASGVAIGQDVATSADVTFNNLTLTGDMDVSGNVTFHDTQTLQVNDSIISLAFNNGADTIDIGMYGQYNDGTERFSGMFRDASDGKWKLYANSTTEPTTTVDVGATGHTTGTLVASLEGDVTATNVTATNYEFTGGADATITRAGAGDINIEGNIVYRAGGTDVPVADGGTGLSNPTDNAVLVGNGTAALELVSASNTTHNVLTWSGSAVVFGAIDGGTY